MNIDDEYCEECGQPVDSCRCDCTGDAADESGDEVQARDAADIRQAMAL